MAQEWKQQREAQREAEAECPLSPINLHRLAIKALELGTIEIPGHFKQRCAERGCTTIDVENVIRDGTICEKPKFNPDWENWRFTMRGRCDDGTLEVRLALDPGVDYETPLLVWITVMKGGSDADGKE